MVDVSNLRSPLLVSPKRVLFRHPSRGGLKGPNSWHAKIDSANQDIFSLSIDLI